MALLCRGCCHLHHLSTSNPHVKKIPSTVTVCSGKKGLKHIRYKKMVDSSARRDTLSHSCRRTEWTINGIRVSACAQMSSLFLMPPVANAISMDAHFSQLIGSLPLADLDPSVAVVLVRVLGPIFASLNFLFIIRIVMSWYPQLPIDKFPYVIAYAPTEPVLEPTRRLIPPVGGVDVSPVIWVAIMSFLNEILLGQQGLLVLLSQQT